MLGKIKKDESSQFLAALKPFVKKKHLGISQV